MIHEQLENSEENAGTNKLASHAAERNQLACAALMGLAQLWFVRRSEREAATLANSALADEQLPQRRAAEQPTITQS